VLKQENSHAHIGENQSVTNKDSFTVQGLYYVQEKYN